MPQSNLVLIVSSCITPHAYLIALWTTSIYSIDTILYPYALPLLYIPYTSSSLCFSCNLSSSLRSLQKYCHMQVHLSGNNIPMVKPPLNHTSLPSMTATLLTTYLMAVLQPSGYSIFHGGDTPIQLGLPWQSYFCQCLNTETSARGNRGFTNETPSISYTIGLYIRLVVTL